MNSFGGSGRRNSASFDGFEILSPSKEYEKKQKVNEECQQYQQLVKRIATASTNADGSSLIAPLGGQDGKKANIHAIIKKDI